MGYFCRKYVMFELKKYRGVMCHDTEERCKILRKNDLQSPKSHEKFAEFSHEQLEVILNNSSVMFYLNEDILWAKISPQILTFWVFYCLSEVF